MSAEILGVCGIIMRALRREKQRLDALTAAVSSVTRELDGLPRAVGINSRVEKLAAAIVDCQRSIGILAGGYISAVVELAALLDAAIDAENIRRVMFFRYGLCKYFRDIGIELGYSERRVYQLHEEGLKIFQLHCSR